jgi:error-prone DNA polymerase
MTLEDETGVANLVVWPNVMERYRRVVMGGRLVLALGRLQKEGEVIHVVGEHLVQRDDLLQKLGTPLDLPPLNPPVARADHVKRPDPERAQPMRHPRDQAKHVLYPSRDFH